MNDNESVIVHVRGRPTCLKCGTDLSAPGSYEKIPGTDIDSGNCVRYQIRCRNCGRIIRVIVYVPERGSL